MSDCLFCKIAAGEIPAKIAYEDDDLIAFHDINPQAPVHLLIVPRRHIASLDEAGDGDGALLGKILLTLQRLARELKIDSGYRVVTNCGASAGQSVFHIHFHLLGGRAMGWPPG
jgi:histidine triad (HIT) family protein